MNRILWIGLNACVLLISSAIALAQNPNAPKVDAKTAIAKQQSTGVSQDPGEKAFQANCSRCHTAPEQLSPRIAGTVTRHMRVRASLSAKDTQAILRYLAP
jgi:cytochrome c5